MIPGEYVLRPEPVVKGTAVRDVFGSKIELRLGDPMDSEVDRKIAKNVPADRPGRGLAVSGHHILGALPRIDGDQDDDTLSTGIEQLVERGVRSRGVEHD